MSNCNLNAQLQLENEWLADVLSNLFLETFDGPSNFKLWNNHPVCSFMPNSGGIYIFASYVVVLYYEFVCKQQQ